MDQISWSPSPAIEQPDKVLEQSLSAEQIESRVSRYKDESDNDYETRLRRLGALQMWYGSQAIEAYAPREYGLTQDQQLELYFFMSAHAEGLGPQAIDAYLEASHDMMGFECFLQGYLEKQGNLMEDDRKEIRTSMQRRYQANLFKPISQNIKNSSDLDEQFLSEYSDMGVEFAVFLSFLGALKDQNVSLSREDIEGLRVDYLRGPQLLYAKKYQSMRTKMQEIYRNNYAIGPGVTKEFQDELLRRFSKRLQNPETRCYSISQHIESASSDALIMFCCLTPEGEGRQYWSALNSDRSLYPAIAPTGAFLQEVLGERHKDDIIDGDCDPTSKIASQYISQKLRFIGVDPHIIASKPSIAIVRDPAVRFISQELSDEEVMQRATENNLPSLPNVIVRPPSKELLLQPWPEGFVLTRHITHQAKGEKYSVFYLVFEKNHGVTWRPRSAPSQSPA